MPGLVPGIHDFTFPSKIDVDGRNKSGHDDGQSFQPDRLTVRRLRIGHSKG